MASSLSRKNATHVRQFKNLNRVFWIIWGVLPFMMYVIYNFNSDLTRFREGVDPEKANCVSAIMADPSNMALEGKILFWGLVAFQNSILVIVFAVLHVTIRRFARERIFVYETLGSLRLMGIILIVWPFLESIVTNMVIYLLRTRGHTQFLQLVAYIDLGPVAVGLFLLALKFVIEHAIDIKSEADLTI